MRITVDHNVIIDLVNKRPNVSKLSDRVADRTYHAHVVEIGASEMRERGVRPDRYDLFEDLLQEAGLESAPRLPPMMIWDVTFWDHCVWCDAPMEAQAKEIEQVLFGGSRPLDIVNNPADAPAWLNRICDVQTLWCHIRSGNDIFVTSDHNFHKETKAPRLAQLGARRIARPEDL